MSTDEYPASMVQQLKAELAIVRAELEKAQAVIIDLKEKVETEATLHSETAKQLTQAQQELAAEVRKGE